MKRLTLVRHAKSDWSIAGQPDWDRVLNPRGLRDAPEMGRRLKARRLKPDCLLTSPAARALATATLIARELKFPASRIHQDERLYHAAPDTLLKVVRELGGTARHVLLVGHNPGLTEFADRISAARRIDHMPTCAVVAFSLDVRDWTRLDWKSAVEATLDYPRNTEEPA